MPNPPTRNRRKLAWAVAAAFALAMLMGTGPGVLLVNNSELRWFGLPVIYVWGLFWYAVQIACVLTAYFKIWPDEEGTEPGPAGSDDS